MPQSEKKTNGESQVTAVDSETADQKQSNIFKDFFIFFRLLFAAQPTWIDYFLIVFGTLCAAGAGLVDDFNGATCAADENTAQGGGDAFQFESAINAKVIKTAWIGAIAFALIYFYLTAWGIISQRLAQRLRNQYLAALLRQPPAFFDTRGAAGVVSSRLQGDITAVQAGTSEKVGTILTTFSFIITVFVIAFSQQPRLAGILISMLPAFLISAVLGGRYLSRYVGKQNEASSAASSIASEALEHISVVQAFSAAPRLESVFGRHMAQSRKHAMVKAAVAAVQTGMLYFVAYSANALAFWQGSIRIADSLTDENGNSTIGQIYAIVYLLIDACVMLGGMAPLLPFLSGAVAAYRRLLEDIETPSNIDATSGEGRSLPPGGSKNITFDNVSFEYPSRPSQQVLKNLNLDFPAGKYTAIVGLSGSGKSTIASLVARLHDPTSGSIKIGDDDLQSLNVKSLRSYMTFVQQEPTLFNCSVLENIAFGLVNSPHQQHQHLKPFLGGPELARLAAKGHNALTAAESEGADVAEVARLVRQAAEQADADGFIGRLTSGYGTSVGTRGTLLSGGQRQRVALAQALIREPEILILDEATASVDSASELRVQQAVEKASLGKRTIISIAHRLSTIRNADNIIVLEAGEIVEQGTYSELMAKEEGKFAHMAKLQRVDSKSHPELESISSSSLDHAHAEKTDEFAVKEDTIRKEDTAQPFSGTIKGIAWLIRPSLSWFVIALIAAAFVGATFSGSGIIFGFTVGALNTCGNTTSNIMSMGRFFAGLIFMLGGVELIANFLAWWGFGVIGERILYSLRILSFRSLLEQGLEWHQSDGRTPSGLLSIITKDCMSVGAFSGSTFGTVFAICINVVIAIIISNIFAWKIALVCLVMIPIQLGAGFMQLRMLARFEERHQEAFTKATSLAQEAIQSIRSVAVLSLEKTYMDTYHRLLEAPRRQVAQSAATTNILLAISHTIGTFINALAYWWGSQLIMKGEYTQRDLLIILVAMLTSAQLWGTMFTLAPEFSRARLAVSRVMKIIDLGSSLHAGKPPKSDVESVSPEKKSSSPPPSAKGGAKVSFKNVGFSYPTRPHAPILNDVTFDIAPNQFCGLVGPSGAGKSTIMSLVQRLYKPTGAP
uniref:Uncharacterized protein n=1 Tax=Bionectria ochroleuca TaxID=29856 RepID=A0A8H7K695_BIOOC